MSPSGSRPPPERATVWLIVAVWLGVVAAGFAASEAYEARPGSVGRPDTSAPRAEGRPSVVVFVHPHCPCTRAALPDLLALGADVRVVFVRPAGVPAGWERSASWELLPRPEVDPDGMMARAAGAATSGFAVARDAAGAVVFRGGVGRGRSRTGDNPGLRAVAAVLAGERPAVSEAAVFGCPLFTPGE